MTAQTETKPSLNGAAGAALEERLRARLATLTAERQTYLDQAQRTMAAYDAAVNELTMLLAPPVPPPDDTE